MQPIQYCEYSLTSIVENLQRDPWPVASQRRPLRSTGAAFAIAVGLLESTFPNTGARMLAFIGGAATQGPGMIVSNELKEPIRSHHDLEKDTAKHHKKALKFYEALSKRITANGHAVDLLVGCLDQVGLLEMRSTLTKTGGSCILADTFNASIFKQSFQRLFIKARDGSLAMGFNATLEVQTSRELKICGMIGPCASLQKKGPTVSETVRALF